MWIQFRYHPLERSLQELRAIDGFYVLVFDEHQDPTHLIEDLVRIQLTRLSRAWRHRGK
jgi:hypothetical protein